ncbi:MAG: helix-turn-helix domain-containing protein, partial [Desulfonauticus sp.]|nr:helix-turn-helix domain-containing protein [Desulfonauticus sp.]
RRLGKSRGYVTKLMRGYYDNLTIKTLVELALALDEDVERFQDLFRLFGDKEYVFPVFNLEKCFPKTTEFNSTSFLGSDLLDKGFSDTEFLGEEELANAA